MTEDQATCGKGLAEHAELPAKVGQLIDALAEMLEVHQTSLVLTDAKARREHEAYVSLAKAYRTIAAQLHTVSKEMESYGDLPMGKHDEAVLTAAAAVDAFHKYVATEEGLLGLLQRAVERDKQMLAELREMT